LVKETKKEGFEVVGTTSKIHCKLFEDNIGALEIAPVHKFRPCTKHINVKMRHFRDYVTWKEVTIHAIRSENQPADFLMKPPSEELLVKHRKVIMAPPTLMSLSSE
jgi:hypothetical protein